MKEVFLARAAELARECRGHYDRILEQMISSGSLEEVAEADLTSFAESVERLRSFCEPLVRSRALIPDEVGALVDFAIPELESFVGQAIGLPAEFSNFIEGLPELDDFGQ